MNDLLAWIKQSYEDERLTSSEKKALRQNLEEAGLDNNTRSQLRAQLFAFAREQAEGQHYKDLILWLEKVNKLLIAPVQADKTQVFFSPGPDCREAIVEHIKNAATSIRICVFTISDDWISDEIIRSHNRGVDIKIITDDEKTHDYGSDVCDFVRAGIEVRIDNSPAHMHHKFAVFDKRTTLTGSYNWTKSATLNNQENILVTDSQAAVEKYLAEFDRLWPRMSPY